MDDAAGELGRALEAVGADGEGAALDQRRAAGGAGIGHPPLGGALVTGLLDPLDHLRDDVAGPLDAHAVPLADVLARHLLAVVQGGAGHGHAADLDRQHDRDGGDDAGPPDRGEDREDAGDLLARRELVGEGPARMARGPAQGVAVGEVVELDHHAVDLVAEVVALGLEAGVVGEDLVDGRPPGHPLVDPEPPGAQGRQHVPLGLQPRDPLGGEDVVGVEVETAGGGELRVELAHGAGGGVARAGEGLLALGDQPFVQAVEVPGEHDDLAADGEERRHRALAVAQLQGDAGDGADVGGDPLPLAPVAAGGRLEEDAVAVDQLDGEAVELGLEHVLDGDVRPQPLAQALVEAAQGGLVLAGVERQHGRRVLDGGEAVDRRAGDALGGGVLGDEVGVLLLQLLQLLEEAVELGRRRSRGDPRRNRGTRDGGSRSAISRSVRWPVRWPFWGSSAGFLPRNVQGGNSSMGPHHPGPLLPSPPALPHREKRGALRREFE